MIPSPIPLDATPGEQRVYEALSALPDNLLVCYRRLFPGRRHIDEPDFVVIGAETGLIVLEVKDWKRGRRPEGLRKENPLEQAKRYVHGLQDLVRKRGFPVLVEAEGPHQNDLVFPCVPTVVFPYLTRDSWEEEEEEGDLDIRHVLFREDLAPQVLMDRLRGLARLYFPPRLTAIHVEFLRGLVAPEFCLEPVSATAPPCQLDPVQMQLVTTDLFLPPPEQRLARDLSARLVRGVAGSGKTLLLLMRAKLLHQLQPSWRILVLTYGRDLHNFLLETFKKLGGDPSAVQITHFHKWCRELLAEAGEWREPLKEGRRLALVAKAIRYIDKGFSVGVGSVAKEIGWIKDYLEPPLEEKYLAAQRTGRQGRITELQRQTMLEILGMYEALLRAGNCCDWEDIPLRVLELIGEGQIAAPRYHALLVDETQDFAPSWFRVLLPMLKTETNLLFLAGDGAQRVYRRDLCWNRLGIQLRGGGRSRILRRVYRNTFEIATYAADWMRQHGVSEDLGRYGEEWVQAEFDHPWVRHGSEPVLTGFHDLSAERKFLVAEIQGLLADGRSPSDILVLSARRDAASATAAALKRKGVPATAVKDSGLVSNPPSVNVCTYHSAKGLEFPIVSCSMTHLFPGGRASGAEDAAKEADTEAARLLYVGMTRARDELYVTYIST